MALVRDLAYARRDVGKLRIQGACRGYGLSKQEWGRGGGRRARTPSARACSAFVQVFRLLRWFAPRSAAHVCLCAHMHVFSAAALGLARLSCARAQDTRAQAQCWGRVGGLDSRPGLITMRKLIAAGQSTSAQGARVHTGAQGTQGTHSAHRAHGTQGTHSPWVHMGAWAYGAKHMTCAQAQAHRIGQAPGMPGTPGTRPGAGRIYPFGAPLAGRPPVELGAWRRGPQRGLGISLWRWEHKPIMASGPGQARPS